MAPAQGVASVLKPELGCDDNSLTGLDYTFNVASNHICTSINTHTAVVNLRPLRQIEV